MSAVLPTSALTREALRSCAVRRSSSCECSRSASGTRQFELGALPASDVEHDAKQSRGPAFSIANRRATTVKPDFLAVGLVGRDIPSPSRASR